MPPYGAKEDYNKNYSFALVAIQKIKRCNNYPGRLCGETKTGARNGGVMLIYSTSFATLYLAVKMR
jgi:hypothetical protein